jgi:transcriptional regulator
MYVPADFLQNDIDEIEQFLQGNSFGTIVSMNEIQLPIATHLPFLIERNGEDFILEGHMAKANQQSELLKKGKNVLLIFQGPNAYVSSAVYDHPNVPTWNYQSVHIHGTIEPMTEVELHTHLGKMVSLHEGKRETPLNYDTLPSEMLKSYSQEIIGFKIVSFNMEAAYKLSQNRNEADYQNIIDDLSKDKKNRSIIEAMNRSKK